MQKPYKFLNLENHEQVSQELLVFLEQHTGLINDLPHFWNSLELNTVLEHVPSLMKFLKQYKLSPIEISVIIFDPNTMYPRIHADPLETYVRILWPVKNCLGSLTKFYDVPKEFLLEGTQTDARDLSKVNFAHHNSLAQGVYYPPLDREWPQIDQYELSAPIAFNGAVPHSVHPAPNNEWSTDSTNMRQNFRISFTMFFDRNLPISKSIDAWDDIFP